MSDLENIPTSYPCTHCNYLAVSHDTETARNMLADHVRTCPNRARVVHSLNVFILDECIYAVCQCDAFEKWIEITFVPWSDTKRRLKELRKWCKVVRNLHDVHVAEMKALR